MLENGGNEGKEIRLYLEKRGGGRIRKEGTMDEGGDNEKRRGQRKKEGIMEEGGRRKKEGIMEGGGGTEERGAKSYCLPHVCYKHEYVPYLFHIQARTNFINVQDETFTL